MANPDSNRSATVLRALSILEFVGDQRRPVSAGDVAEGIGVDRSTAYRMLMTLAEGGYIARDERSRNFRLSFKVLSLARTVLDDDERTNRIASTLREISDATGETVHYSMFERDCAVLVLRAKGVQRVSVDFQIGDRSPLTSTSIGKVLLAYRDLRIAEGLIAHGLSKTAPNTITDPDAFRRELTRVRAQGYAYDDLEFAPDMRCLAIPVFENGGEVPGGVAISGPSSRFDHAKLDELRLAAMDKVMALSRSLGGLA